MQLIFLSLRGGGRQSLYPSEHIETGKKLSPTERRCGGQPLEGGGGHPLPGDIWGWGLRADPGGCFFPRWVGSSPQTGPSLSSAGSISALRPSLWRPEAPVLTLLPFPCSLSCTCFVDPSSLPVWWLHRKRFFPSLSHSCRCLRFANTDLPLILPPPPSASLQASCAGMQFFPSTTSFPSDFSEITSFLLPKGQFGEP